MGVWHDRIENSGIDTKMRELGAILDKGVAREDNADEDVEGLERIRTVLKVIGERIATADGHLLIASSLEHLCSELTNAIAQVAAFADTGSPEQLTNANQSMDRALSAFGAFVFPASTADLEGLREAATAYRTTMARELELWGASASNSRERIADLDKKVTALAEQLTAEGNRLAGVVKGVEDAASATSTRLEAAYDASTKKLDADNGAKLTEWQAAFDAAEDERDDAHEKKVAIQDAAFEALNQKHDGILTATDATWDKKLSDANTAHVAAHAKLQTDYQAKGAGIIATMEGQLSRVQELVGAIGDHGVTAGFKAEADAAKQEVVYWQRVTFWSMMFLIAVGVATAFHVFEYKPTWISLASRLYLSIATGVLAAYAASQASRYQQRERRNRKLELELRALGPFLEPVDKAEREKFRLKIAEVFFGKDDGSSDKPGPATALELSTGTAEKLVDIVKAAVEKLPGK